VKVLIDSDVLLDVALRRVPFWQASLETLKWAEQSPGRGAVAWHSFSNLQYLLRGNARAFISDLLLIVDVPKVDTDALRSALQFKMTDLEDAMQAASAVRFGANYIITRNIPDYQNSPVVAILPAEFLNRTAGK